MFKKVLGIGGVVVVLAFLGIQLVQVGPAHANPAVVKEPAWDSPRTRELAKRACFDCHSNETVWPAYSNVAPISWIVGDHVAEGREVMNFSEWNREYDEADEAGEVVEEGEMPLWDYALMHPEAKLTDAERAELIKGLNATFGGEGGEAGERAPTGGGAEAREAGERGERGGDDDGDDR